MKKHLLILSLVLAIFWMPLASAQSTDMSQLCRIKDAETRSISPENLTGEKAKGGMATIENAFLERLNEREREILRLLAEGQTSVEIAERLGLSSKTVDNYRSAIMRKLNIHHLPGLVKIAIQHGVISLE